MSDEPFIPRGPGFLPTFLYYFSGTALVTTFLAVKSLGVGLETGIPGEFGLLFGALGGLVASYFNHNRLIDIPFTNRKAFLTQLEQALAEMGYAQDTDATLEDVLVYHRAALRQLFSGRIYVRVGEKQATLSSRALHIRGLKKRLQ
ncbi:MAG TPA: hypothetical protein V6D07_11985 [Trichocoleus sp.]